nr:MAG TPA: hypothetical protein [Caudoviricetes sp.]
MLYTVSLKKYGKNLFFSENNKSESISRYSLK